MGYVGKQMLVNFLQTVEASFNLGELIELFNTQSHHCIFIKNEHSTYHYGNDNSIQLMGLKNLEHLRSLNDYDMSKNKKDADLYREYDRFILEESKTLTVSETLSPKYNRPIVKTMQGKLYPLHLKSERANYILGVITPESKLLKLDFDTLFNLSQQELSELLIKRSYTINLPSESITLSKMEIRTLVQLLKGSHAGEIAKELQIKQTTAESYLLNIKNKLAVNSKSELINLVIGEKLLQQIIL